MERAVNDKTIMGGEWGFYKERVIQWPQLKPAKCQDTEISKMLVEEAHLHPPKIRPKERIPNPISSSRSTTKNSGNEEMS